MRVVSQGQHFKVLHEVLALAHEIWHLPPEPPPAFLLVNSTPSLVLVLNAVATALSTGASMDPPCSSGCKVTEWIP